MCFSTDRCCSTLSVPANDNSRPTARDDRCHYNEDTDDLLTELIDEEGADDTRELQEACATPNSLFSALQIEYNDLLVNYTNVEDIKSSQSLHTLRDHVNHVKENLKLARTASLCLMLMQIVAIIRMFIRTECTANWHLHLKSTHDMLPYFAAACNNNYAMCCILYLQDCQDMCVCLRKPLEEGAFTIHRNENLFWSGTWTDMTIEQSLVRSGKTHGGLVNITHKESARTQLLLTSHIVAQYSEALRKLTDNAGGRSERHRELIEGSRIRDHDDLQT